MRFSDFTIPWCRRASCSASTTRPAPANRLLDTIRAYAKEKLLAGGPDAEDQLRQRHLNTYLNICDTELGVCRRWRPHSRRDGQSLGRARLRLTLPFHDDHLCLALAIHSGIEDVNERLATSFEILLIRAGDALPAARFSPSSLSLFTGSTPTSRHRSDALTLQSITPDY